MHTGSPDWRRGKFPPTPFDKLPRHAHGTPGQALREQGGSYL
jgi:hypothetical protein